MSAYTTEVRYICEAYAGREENGDFTDIDNVVNASRRRIFGNYPIFDENYRATLEAKILKHYYTREICEETVALWKLRLQNRMNEIMPYFNKLYSSELIEFNPLYDVDLNTTGNKTGERDGTIQTDTDRDVNRNIENNTSESRSTSDNRNEMETHADNHKKDEVATFNVTDALTGSTTTTNSGTQETDGTDTNQRTISELHWDKYSDTPQGGITGIDSDRYLTNARKNTASDNIGDSGTNHSETDFSNSGSENVSETKRKTGTIERDIDETTDGAKTIIKGGEENTSISKDNDITMNTDEDVRKTETQDINTTETYLQHVYGKRGSATYSKMIMEYRDTFLNIDLQVINALDDLFFRLW